MFRSPVATLRAASSIPRLTIAASSSGSAIRHVSSSGAPSTTIGDAVKQDHRELQGHYKDIVGATSEDTKARYQNQFTWELARHSVAEELLLYPAFEKHLGDGKDRASRGREEHRKVREFFIFYF